MKKILFILILFILSIKTSTIQAQNINLAIPTDSNYIYFNGIIQFWFSEIDTNDFVRFEIKKVLPGQSMNYAYYNNPFVMDTMFEMKHLLHLHAMGFVLPQHIIKQIYYAPLAIRVRQYAKNGPNAGTLLGDSQIRFIYGVKCINYIKSGGHYLFVDSCNCDYNNLNGNGKIEISYGENPLYVPTRFSNLKVTSDYANDKYRLESGTIYYKDTNNLLKVDTMIANKGEEFGNAYFKPTELRLRNEDGLYVKGLISWKVPFAKDCEFKNIETDYLNYNDFSAMGIININKKDTIVYTYDTNYKFILNETTYFGILSHHFSFMANGRFVFPNFIKNNSNNAYYTSDVSTLNPTNFSIQNPTNNIKIFNNSNIELAPYNITVDFSKKTSENTFNFNIAPEWTGVSIDSFSINIPKITNTYNNIALNNLYKLNYSRKSNARIILQHDTLKELTLPKKIIPSNSNIGKIHGFDGSLNSFELHYINNKPDTNYFSGFKAQINIPFINDSALFDLKIPITDFNIENGTLDTNIVDYTYSPYNPTFFDFKIIEITPNINAFIDTAAKKVSINGIPYPYDPTKLRPWFNVGGVNVTVDSITQLRGISMINLTVPKKYRIHTADGKYQEWTVGVMVIGVEEVKQADNDISCYPNPCINEININNPQKYHLNRYFIYDINGNMIKSDIIDNKDNQTIDINEFTSGTYYVRLQVDDKVYISKKIIKL